MSVERDWRCPNYRCRNWVYSHKDVCGKCKSPRPKLGDWTCPACSKLNFASRVDCFECHRSKLDDGLPKLASLSPPSKPGDWICGSAACGASNFAKRVQCYKCAKPRNAGPIPAAQPAGAPVTANSDCVVCCDEKATYVVMPCAHCCLCLECTKRIKNTKCPICQGPADSFLRVFIS